MREAGRCARLGAKKAGSGADSSGRSRPLRVGAAGRPCGTGGNPTGEHSAISGLTTARPRGQQRRRAAGLYAAVLLVGNCGNFSR